MSTITNDEDDSEEILKDILKEIKDIKINDSSSSESESENEAND